MKLTTKIYVVLGALFAVTGIALSQAVPVPAAATFNPVFGTMAADAGYFGSLTVLGPLASTGSATISGVSGCTYFDGGANTGINVCGVEGSMYPEIRNDTYGNIILDGVSGQGVSLYTHGTQDLTCNYGGSGNCTSHIPFAIGNGNSLTNVGEGFCSLSGATCNAVVGGALGTSLCEVGLKSSTALTTGMCTYIPDAGSASIYCPSATTGVVTIHCEN